MARWLTALMMATLFMLGACAQETRKVELAKAGTAGYSQESAAYEMQHQAAQFSYIAPDAGTTEDVAQGDTAASEDTADAKDDGLGIDIQFP